MKYKRFIDAIGGWAVLQGVLRRCAEVARRHGVSIANVATRWVLEQPAVAAVIVGARLGEREHRADNLRLFSFALDAEDRARIDAALAAHPAASPAIAATSTAARPSSPPPAISAIISSGLPPVYRGDAGAGPAGRLRVDTGSVWEPICGYSRAVRVGDRILVSGTTATHGAGEVVCPGDPARPGRLHPRQDRGEHRRARRHASRTWCARASMCATPTTGSRSSRVHGRYFGEVRPANTLVEVSRLVGEYAGRDRG